MAIFSLIGALVSESNQTQGQCDLGLCVTIIAALVGGWVFYLRKNYLLALAIPILLPLVHLELSFLVTGICSAY